jgi:uncharacterized protein (DUF342 family)
VELKIDRHGLEARLAMAPVRKETGESAVPSVAEIEIFLKEKGVLVPLDRPSLEAGLARLAEGLSADPVVARGHPPAKGGDGYLEYLIDFDATIAPAAGEDGAVDLRASLIHNVAPGQPLAVIHPPKPGHPGFDVFRRLLPGLPGTPLDPKLGRNTQRSLHDPNLILASTLGHACIVDGVLEVQEFYLVDGDVDYNSGNVSFGKSVQVRGDVKAGFSLDAGGDVEVTGLVEDCNVKAKGGVLVRGGFTGQGKGFMQADGEITLGYVRNQQVRGEDSIRIQKEAVNSRMQSRRDITVNGLLAGGKAQARYAVECQVAGTETGTTTHLEAGHDYAVAEEMSGIRAEMEKMGKYAKRLEESLRQIHDIEKLNRSLEPWTIELLFELERMRGKVDAKIKEQRERFSTLDRQAWDPKDATITVHKKAFPGVVVKIGKDVMLVDKILSGPKTFYSKDGTIQIR